MAVIVLIPPFSSIPPSAPEGTAFPIQSLSLFLSLSPLPGPPGLFTTLGSSCHPPKKPSFPSFWNGPKSHPTPEEMKELNGAWADYNHSLPVTFS